MRDAKGRFIKQGGPPGGPRGAPPVPASHGTRDGLPRYEAFLSALAEVTGALVALLFGFVGAYYVFLLERSSHFDDLSAEHKTEIRRTLTRLREAWPMPPTFYSHLPPDFDEHVRAAYPNMSDAELLGSVMTDLHFELESSQLRTVVELDLVKGGHIGPWKGRVYYWILGQTVEVLTVRPPPLAKPLRAVVSDKIPRGIFPMHPSGPGFANWRASYDTIREWANFYLVHRKGYGNEYRDDYRAYISTRVSGMHSKTLNEIFNESTGTLFQSLGELEREVDAIDSNTVFAGRYSTDRLHLLRLLVLALSASVAGIVVPLALLAWQSAKLTSRKAATLLVGTLLCLAAAYGQLASDLELKEDLAAYFHGRWYRPLLAETDSQLASAKRDGVIDTSHFESALRSRDRSSFPDGILEALQALADRANALRQAASELNSCALLDLRSDPVIGDLVGKPSNEGGSVLSPHEVADPDQFDDWLKGYKRTSRQGINIETPGPSWSVPKARIRPPATEEEKNRLVAALQRFHERLVFLDEAKKFRSARADSIVALERLQDELRQLVRPQVQFSD